MIYEGAKVVQRAGDAPGKKYAVDALFFCTRYAELCIAKCFKKNI